MKRNYALIFLLAALMLLGACAKAPAQKAAGSLAETPAAATPAETAQPTAEPSAAQPADYNALYQARLAEIRDFVLQGANASAVPEGITGIMEICMAAEAEDALQQLGYQIADISGDGVPELIVSSVSSDDASGYILAIYTIAEDQAVTLIAEGWARNRYYLLDDNSIYHEGSGGAAYSSFGVYRLSQDAAALNCTDYYFTYEKVDGNWDDIGIYHNTTGVYDKAQSELLDAPADTFWTLQEPYSSRIQTLNLTPLSEL